MRIKDIYYQKLIDILNCFNNEQYNEDFFTSLGEGDNLEFTSLIEQLNNKVEDIEIKKLSSELFEDIDSICNVISLIKDGYPSYDSKLVSNYFVFDTVFRKIIDLINSESENRDLFDSNDDLPIEQFMLIDLTEPIKYNNFYFYNDKSISDSVIIITPKELDKYRENIYATNSLELLSQLLAKICIEDISLLGATKCLVKNGDIKQISLVSYIEMIQVSQGLAIHNPINASAIFQSKLCNEFKIDKDYQQFREVTYALSEFNDKKDILDKYLRIYHVIENFMYRIPICKLLTKNGNKMFSIRDFKRLYKNIGESEQSNLELFFREVLEIEYDKVNKKKIKSFVMEAINEFKRNRPLLLPKIKSEITQYEFINENQLNQLTENSLKNDAPKFIYILRNSIVHNKETEKHMSYFNLTEELGILIDELILPILMEIVYSLIINKEPIISYSGSEIYLFETGA